MMMMKNQTMYVLIYNSIQNNIKYNTELKD